MPKKAKEKTDELKEKSVKKDTNTKKIASKKVASKKTASKVNTKKVALAKTPSTTKKKTATEKKSGTKQTTTTKNSTTKKVPTKAKKTVDSKKEPIKRKTTKKKVEIVEYYDLPYRYNQTVVKVLAQTPTTLFVYWDISDDDRKKYIKQYGEYFFHNTKPVLIIHNKTKNYDFEVDIDDFANSWYLRLIDSNCDYQIELGRRPINKYVNISNNYLYISTSNEIESPNDHILFDRLSHFVYFRNVKTNETVVKNIANFTLLQKIGKFDIKKLYEILYPDEVLELNRLHFGNPSSR